MSRLLRVELLILLVLGFSLGVVLFMYWKARGDLSSMASDYKKLSKKILESDSETVEAKALLYKKRLEESDAQYMKQEESERARKIDALTQEVEELKKKLKSTTQSKCDVSLAKLQVEKEELEGIQSKLISDAQSCEKRSNRCEKSKAIAIKASKHRGVDPNKLEELTKRAVDCESKVEALEQQMPP